MSVMPLEYVAPPAATPAKYGILTAAVVIEDSDPHMGLGYEYVPDFCGPTETTIAACLDGPAAAGTAVANVAADRTVTVDLTGAPAGPYEWDWGDGTTTSGPEPATHTYPAGTSRQYGINVTGPGGYSTSLAVNVTTGATSGPYNSAGVTRTQKQINDDGRDVVEGEPFAVYALSRCKAVGLGDAQARASRSLTAGEGRGVEQWLGDRLAAEAVILGGSESPTMALAIVEQFIHCNYGAQGTIHMSRGLASILAGTHVIESSGNALLTQLGNVVSAGCYDREATDVGPNRIWATGPVMLRRGSIIATPHPILDPKTNDTYALAERPYAGSWECFAVGVDVTTGP